MTIIMSVVTITIVTVEVNGKISYYCYTYWELVHLSIGLLWLALEFSLYLDLLSNCLY